jgi:hypothetical protein
MLDAIVYGLAHSWPVIGAIAFFLLALLGMGLIAPHNKLPGRGNAPLPMKSLGKMPILQVELARNRNDLEMVLAPGNLERNIQDARIGNNLDTFLFIPSYAGLLISLGLILARGDERWRTMLLLVALVAVPLAAVCDWTENSGIAKVLDKLDHHAQLQDSDATRTSTPSFIKWTTLAYVLLVYGAAAFRGLGWKHGALAVLAVLGVGLGAELVFMLIKYLQERIHGSINP